MRFPQLNCLLLISLLTLTGSPLADNSGPNPLQPATTGSPRDTLQGFVETLNRTHVQIGKIIRSYFASKRLYLSAAEQAEVNQALQQLERIRGTLDLSEMPQALADKLAEARVLQLKEVLDRIDLPPFETVPDATDMRSREFRQWTIPNTEITIARVEQGARAGEYLFSPETVERIPEFYRKIQHLPYLPGATAGWYERYRYGGGGLYKVVPYRWMNALPDWSTTLLLDQPLWRWFGVAVVLLAAMLVYRLGRRAARAWVSYGANQGLRELWAGLVPPALVLVLVPLLVHIFSWNLRLSGAVMELSTLALWAMFTLSLTWLVWSGSHALAESIVTAQQLNTGSIDSQLIRLGIRLFATILSITILVVGAQHLGIPAYSVIAGLGVGGIAVALAAKDSLANLLGSLLIMFEKPFRVGHWIKLGDTEGVVESIGFRSTRIRTFYDSLVSIPSNTLVNSTVDNMELRHYRRVRTVLQIRYDTPADRVEAFVAAIREIVIDDPSTRKDEYRIRLDDFGEYGLQILVNFYLEVPDWQTEQEERQRILMQILKLAESMHVRFALPVPYDDTGLTRQDNRQSD